MTHHVKLEVQLPNAIIDGVSIYDTSIRSYRNINLISYQIKFPRPFFYVCNVPTYVPYSVVISLQTTQLISIFEVCLRRCGVTTHTLKADSSLLKILVELSGLHTDIGNGDVWETSYADITMHVHVQYSVQTLLQVSWCSISPRLEGAIGRCGSGLWNYDLRKSPKGRVAGVAGYLPAFQWMNSRFCQGRWNNSSATLVITHRLGISGYRITLLSTYVWFAMTVTYILPHKIPHVGKQ